MTKRLTEKQKEEILKSFKSGIAIDFLSQKYSCTNSTIIRNLKKNLGEYKFKELFNKIKLLNNKSKTIANKNINLLETNSDNEDFKKESNEPKFLNENICPKFQHKLLLMKINFIFFILNDFNRFRR